MASTKSRSYNDYTIGWLCALPKEQTAATLMLDKQHPSLQNPPGDPNNYTLGSIGEHNIVIACLPLGQIGANSAATIATWMISTYSRIRIGLMVGIGGGIPINKVRLGDVVVSSPAGQFPGVVQWDMGRESENAFQRTGALSPPPTSLLAALAKINTAHDLGRNKIPAFLQALQRDQPDIASRYLRSKSHKDVLFKSTYAHVIKEIEEDEDEVDEEDNCQHCDKTQVVKRPPRDPCVHYGLIASGNRVISDAGFRNKLNKDLGGQVLCVDMEAAGLMLNFPCVVIRGICDYADSHKNDTWQNHAAVIAAAFAKDLLQYVQAGDIERESLIKDLIIDVHKIVSKAEAGVTQITSMAERNENREILNWLTPTDYSVQQNIHIGTRQEGTGQWLLNSTEFSVWVEADKQILFCSGIPGAGKTILAAIVIDNLISRFANDLKIGIAYIYFNFWQEEEHTIEDLFANLLKQLARGLSSLPPSVKSLYDDYMESGARPRSDKISKVIQSVIRVSYKRVFIVVDALDEFQASQSCRMEFIDGIFGFQQCGASILVTSRPIPDITDRFEGISRLEIRASDDDMSTFVDGQISQEGSESLQEMQAEASNSIMKAADGMFLLAKLDLDSLLDIQLPKDIRTRLQNLPRGSKAYSQAYEEIMKRVERQGPKSVKFAKAVLSWVTCAKRPLVISELQHALAVENGSKILNEGDLPQAQAIISVCAGLVTIDKDSNVIRLFHYTAKEYFEQTQDQWFPGANNNIAKICITYLSFDIFDTGFCLTDAAFEKRLQSYPLYHYASCEWGYHARESTVPDQLVLDFLMKQTKTEAFSQVLFAVKKSEKPGYSQDIPRRTSGLHLAAYFGLEKVVKALLELNNSDLRDSYNRTPLSLAAENGHEVVVRLLLNKGANSKAKDQSSLTPLSWAAMGGHQTVVRLFDPDSPSQLDDIAIAAKRKLQKFFLMRESVQIMKESKQVNMERQRLFQEAGAINIRLDQIKNQKQEIDNKIRRLQREKKRLTEKENGEAGDMPNLSQIQADTEGKQGNLSKQWIHAQTELGKLRQMDGSKNEYVLANITDLILFRLAVEDGFAEIVELLLCGGTDAIIANEDGWLPLHTAASKGYDDIVGLLVDMGKVQVDSKDNDGRTALHVAVEKGHQDVVQSLLKRGAVMGYCQQTFEGHTGYVLSVKFSNESKLLASASSDNTIKLWDITTGKCQQTLESHSGSVYSVAFSHDSKLVASGSMDQTVKLWNTATGRCQQTFNGHVGYVFSVAFSHDSKLVASGSWDNTVKLWNIATGKCQWTLKEHSGPVISAIFSHDSKLVASVSSDNTVKLWATATGKCQQTLKGYSTIIHTIAFWENSKLIMSGSSDNIITLWGSAMGERQQRLNGHSLDINSVAFSPSSKLTASGSDDKTIKLWDIATGKCQQTLEGHSSMVYSVAFSHDSNLIASGSIDGSVKIWVISTGI